MRGLLQIGELARLGGVSVKALRFYDDQGLLRPEHVDPKTGYRYYTLDQAATLAIITNLRFVDFSISEISHILNAGDGDSGSVKSAIEEKQKTLERERATLAGRIKIAKILAQASASGYVTPPTLKLTRLEPQRVYSVQRKVPHLGAPVTEMFEAAETRAAEEKARAPLAPFLIFHDRPDQEADLEVEVCIPVTEEMQEAESVKTIKGADIACTVVYAGGYFKTETLFAQMIGWIEHAGLQPSGPLREVYHRFGADQESYRLPKKMLAQSSRDFLTELQIPLRMTLNKNKENDE